MDAEIFEKYVDRIYGWAVKHTYTSDEAEELSQEILLRAMTELSRLRDESRFEPWLWGIAKNVWHSFSRYRGRLRSVMSFDSLPEPVAPEESEDSLPELLLARILKLSAIYREIIILHYYDRLSTKEISMRLGVPEGTVTWRLSEARRKLKKELEVSMYSSIEETALHPIKMRLDIYGSGSYGAGIPYPNEYISDALSQNILWHAYEEPMTVEALASSCGVPAYYIEASLANLKKREAVIEPSRGRFQTDLPIFSDRHGLWLKEKLPELISPLSESMYSAIERVYNEMERIEHYRAKKSRTTLFCLYAVMAFVHLSEKFCRLPYPEIPAAYDGNCWRYIGHTESTSNRVNTVGRQSNSNIGSRGHFSLTQFNFLSFKWKPLLYDLEINVCEDILINGTTEDKWNLSSCIAGGWIEKRGEELFVKIPAFRADEYAEFVSIVERELADLIPSWDRAATAIAKDYAELFPKHLANDGARLSRYLWFSSCGELFELWQGDGRLNIADGEDGLAVMIERKKK